jgi:hypothetical protein
MTNPETPSTAPVAWCQPEDFRNALSKRQSFSGWREQHTDCDMALYAQPQVSHPAAADQAERPSVDDVVELCQEFGFHFDSDDVVNLSILRDVITAAITRWPLAVARPITSDWQPIETAPRDGTDFVAYNEFTGPYITAAKSISPIAAPPDGTIRFPMHYWHGQKGTWFPEPTHWQPLPSPPPIHPITPP